VGGAALSRYGLHTPPDLARFVDTFPLTGSGKVEREAGAVASLELSATT
jgi:hypothetical protein